MKLRELFEDDEASPPLNAEFESPDGEICLSIDFDDQEEREGSLWVRYKPGPDDKNADHAKRWLYNLHANPTELKHAERVSEIPPDIIEMALNDEQVDWVNKQLEPYDVTIDDAQIDDPEVVEGGTSFKLEFPSVEYEYDDENEDEEDDEDKGP